MDVSAHQHRHRQSLAGDQGCHHEATTAKDPVCGMAVDPATSPHRADLAGKAYAFCCAGCRAKFLADPERYLAAALPAADTPLDVEARYTCPMHPEVEQIGPGSCPFCGMALEPLDFEADAGPDPELADMTRRLWLAAALTVPVVLLAMAGHLVAPPPANVSHWLQMLLTSAVVLWIGWPFFARGWRSIATRHLNMFTLIAIGTGVAWLYSVVATLAPGLFPASVREHDGTVGVYFEAAAVIVTLVLLGQVLELRARAGTGGAVRALLDLTPKVARVVAPDGSDHERPIAELRVGDRFRVRPGEKVAVDGTVIEGRSTLDQSMVTGESMPAAKGPGDAVVGGTLNQSGSLVVEARKVGRDTLLAQIVRLVADAQRSRAPIQRLADRVSGFFVPAVLAVAVAAFAVWIIVGPEPRLASAVIAAVSVLIIACPCALGLATPMSIMVGVGRGAEAGILVRKAESLERLERVDTLVIDKTGTLTEGRPTVSSIETAPDVDEAVLLGLVAGVERSSEHPLGRAIVAEAARRGISPGRGTAFEASVGKGAAAEVDGRRVVVGSSSFLTEQGLRLDGLAAAIEAVRRDGATAVVAAIDGRPAGVIGIADPVRESSRAAVADLQRLGLRVVMLTGDNRRTAEAVARRLGLSDVEADVLPDQKAEVVRRLKAAGRVVAMAGDGVNDAPALALADVGIAMATGTDIAMESAGLTLLGGDLAGLLRARRLSVATMTNIRQNLWFAFAYNALGVPVAAGVLYPVLGVTLSPMLAAAAMALSSVSVIANALRLRRADLS